MSELLEQPRQVERDLSRAHWQRTVGQVVMTEALASFLETESPDLSNIDLDEVHSRAEKLQDEWHNTPLTENFFRAHILAEKYFQERFTAPFSIRRNEEFRAQLNSRTYLGDANFVIAEAARAQAHFPLNLAYAVSETAKTQEVTGFVIDTLADMGAVLRRPDFQNLVHESLLTRNGIWQSFSTNMFPVDWEFSDLFTGDEAVLGFEFDAQGKVSFETSFKSFLRGAITFVNKHARRDQIMAAQSSSGCPIRHIRPQFRNTEEDHSNLDMLSEMFQKPKETLQAPMSETIETTALNATARLLENAHIAFEKYDVERAEESVQ